MDATSPQSAIFIVPRSSSAWKGAEAIWVTIAGWALAAEKHLGHAVVVTSDGIATPQEVLSYPKYEPQRKLSKSRFKKFIPAILRIFLKDLLLLTQSRKVKSQHDLPVNGSIRFIWEQHDLFFGNGKRLAKKYNVPLIKYVHAPIVWEASKWGVKRYCWGALLEKLEIRSLKSADVVLVVSKEVKQKLVQMGIPVEKILISPMGVNPELFANNTLKPADLRLEFQFENKLILGWIGSFRAFHGIKQVIKAFNKVVLEFPEVRLILVGDGVERKDAELLVKRLNIQEKVLFTGKKQYLEIPAYLSLFDIAIVSARRAEGFHYSPLKLREYWAAGKAVIAPRAGEILENFENDRDLKLFTPGDIEDLGKAMVELIKDKNKRKVLGSNGKAKVFQTGTWEVELNKLLRYLEENECYERET